MNRIIETYSIYSIICLLCSIILKLTLTNNRTPITKTKGYRIFGILPIREIIILPPISFICWFYISKSISDNKIHISNLLFESLIALFFSGIIFHKLFGVKSKLGAILNITQHPDGTGLVPNSNW